MINRRFYLKNIIVMTIVLYSLASCVKKEVDVVHAGFKEILINNGAEARYWNQELRGANYCFEIYLKDEYSLDKIKSIMVEIDDYLEIEDNYNYYFSDSVSEIFFEFRNKKNKDDYYRVTTYDLDKYVISTADYDSEDTEILIID